MFKYRLFLLPLILFLTPPWPLMAGPSKSLCAQKIYAHQAPSNASRDQDQNEDQGQNQDKGPIQNPEPDLRSWVTEIERYQNNVKFMRDPHSWHLVDFPQDSFPSLKEWKWDFLERLSQLPKSTIEEIKYHLKSDPKGPNLNSKVATQYWFSDEALLAFLLRDDEYLKTRLDYIYKDFVHIEIKDYLRLARHIEHHYLFKLFSPHFKNYFEQNKDNEGGKNFLTLPKKRMSDLIITYLSLRDLDSNQLSFTNYYQSYLDKVRSLLPHHEVEPKERGFKNRVFLTKVHEKLQSAILEKKISPDTQLVFWGSFLNGRSHDKSDLDYEVFGFDPSELDRKLGEEGFNFQEFLSTLIESTYNSPKRAADGKTPMIIPELTDKIGQWASPDELIQFGLITQGFVFSITQEGVFAHFQINFPQDGPFETLVVPAFQ